MTKCKRLLRHDTKTMTHFYTKTFCSTKDSLKKAKIQSYRSEKTPENNISDKGIASRKYKQPPRLEHKKTKP